MTPITLGIPFQLLVPEVNTGGRLAPPPAAPVSMPKASMDKHNGPESAQHDIRATRQGADVESTPNVPMPDDLADKPAHDQFRRCLHASDSRHVGASRGP